MLGIVGSGILICLLAPQKVFCVEGILRGRHFDLIRSIILNIP